MAEVQLRNLSKRWGSFVGVHELDLTIADRPGIGEWASQKSWKLHPQIGIASAESVLVHLHSLDLHDG